MPGIRKFDDFRNQSVTFGQLREVFVRVVMGLSFDDEYDTIGFIKRIAQKSPFAGLRTSEIIERTHINFWDEDRQRLYYVNFHPLFLALSDCSVATKDKFLAVIPNSLHSMLNYVLNVYEAKPEKVPRAKSLFVSMYNQLYDITLRGQTVVQEEVVVAPLRALKGKVTELSFEELNLLKRIEGLSKWDIDFIKKNFKLYDCIEDMEEQNENLKDDPLLGDLLALLADPSDDVGVQRLLKQYEEQDQLQKKQDEDDDRRLRSIIDQLPLEEQKDLLRIDEMRKDYRDSIDTMAEKIVNTLIYGGE